MPYDQDKIRNMLKIAGGYEATPMGGFLKEMAEQLAGAQDAILEAQTRARNAEMAQNRAATEMENAHAIIRKLRDGNTGATEAIETLKAIARNPKGSQKLAADALAKINAATPA